MTFSLRQVWIVALKEFRDCIRGRWIAVGAILFAIISLAIVYGTAAIGGTLDFRPLDVVINSFVSLTVFLLPLIAFLIAFDAFVGEEENGTLLLMMTYPISRFDLLMGKAAGQSGALLLTLVFGFLPFVILSAFGTLPYSPAELVKGLFPVIGCGWLLGICSILCAYLVSLTAESKNRALAFLLLIWLALVLLYDLALLILAIGASDTFGKEVMLLLMLVNPASVYRMINQELLGVTQFGFSPVALTGIFGLWIFGLVLIDFAVFRRRRV